MYNVHMNKLKILFEIRFVKLLNFDILLKPDWDFEPDPGYRFNMFICFWSNRTATYLPAF